MSLLGPATLLLQAHAANLVVEEDAIAPNYSTIHTDVTIDSINFIEFLAIPTIDSESARYLHLFLKYTGP